MTDVVGLLLAIWWWTRVARSMVLASRAKS